MIWTDEQKARLAMLWQAGVPTQKIADELGRTQNAVIGQADRLNLPTHIRQRSGGRKKGTPNRAPRSAPAFACDLVLE